MLFSSALKNQIHYTHSELHFATIQTVGRYFFFSPDGGFSTYNCLVHILIRYQVQWTHFPTILNCHLLWPSHWMHFVYSHCSSHSNHLIKFIHSEWNRFLFAPKIPQFQLYLLHFDNYRQFIDTFEIQTTKTFIMLLQCSIFIMQHFDNELMYFAETFFFWYFSQQFIVDSVCFNQIQQKTRI